MKHFIFTLVISLIACLNLNAENVVLTEGDVNDPDYQGVNFYTDLTFDEVKALAKKDGKKIFIDCYTSWCGPCKQMLANEFPKKEMGDYLNSNFVCTKYDIEKGEGITIGEIYDVNVFPTYLILDSNGNPEMRFIGYNPSDKFIPKMQAGPTSNDVYVLKKNYDAGNREPEFMKEYFESLQSCYMRNTAKSVAKEMLRGKTAKEIVNDKESFDIFVNNYDDASDKTFQDIYKMKANVKDLYGDKAIKKMDEVWQNELYKCMKFSGHDLESFDEAKLNKTYKELKKYNIEGLDKMKAKVYEIRDMYKGNK